MASDPAFWCFPLFLPLKFQHFGGIRPQGDTLNDGMELAQSIMAAFVALPGAQGAAYHAGWGRSLLAALVQKTTITSWCLMLKAIFRWGYKPTFHWGAILCKYM